MSIEYHVKEIEKKQKEIKELKAGLNREKEKLNHERAQSLGFTHKPTDISFRQLEVLSIFAKLSKELNRPPTPIKLNRYAGGGKVGVRPQIKELYYKGYLTNHEAPKYYYRVYGYTTDWFIGDRFPFDHCQDYITWKDVERFISAFVKPEEKEDFVKFIEKRLEYPSTTELYISKKAMDIMITEAQ